MALHLGAFLPLAAALGSHHARLAEGAALPEGPAWPQCQNSSADKELSLVGLWANVKKHGATSGCKNDDCTRSDSFEAEGPERCAQVCYSLSGCVGWAFQQQQRPLGTAAGKCWLRANDAGHGEAPAEPIDGAVTGGKSCIPVNWPECQFDGYRIDGGVGQALYLNLSEQDLAYNCTKYPDMSIKNCKERDSFAAKGIEDCAAFCNKIPSCMWWSYGLEEPLGLPVCLLRTGGHRKALNARFVSGKSWCSPVRVSRAIATNASEGVAASSVGASDKTTAVSAGASDNSTGPGVEDSGDIVASGVEASDNITASSVEASDNASAYSVEVAASPTVEDAANFISEEDSLGEVAAETSQSNTSTNFRRARTVKRTLARAVTLRRHVARLRRRRHTPPLDLPECLQLNNQFVPLDMPNQPRTLELDIYACEARCFNTTGCAHFSFDPSGVCHLQDESAKPRATPGYISGEPGCKAGITSMAKTLPLHGSVPPFPALSPEELPTCATQNVRYMPLDMDGHPRSSEADAFACQARCAGIGGCGHFTYWANGGCHVQDENAKPSAMKGALAGPPACEYPARAEKRASAKSDKFLGKVMHEVAKEVERATRNGLTIERGEHHSQVDIADVNHFGKAR